MVLSLSLRDKDYGQNGCGRNALSLITGFDPLSFPEKKHYSTAICGANCRIAESRRNGYRMRCNTEPQRHLLEVQPHHVVLVSQLMIRMKPVGGHSFRLILSQFRSLSIAGIGVLNHPLLSAYLLFHPKWGILLSIKRRTHANQNQTKQSQEQIHQTVPSVDSASSHRLRHS